MTPSSSAAPLFLLFLDGAQVLVLSRPLHTSPVKMSNVNHFKINCKEDERKPQQPQGKLFRELLNFK